MLTSTMFHARAVVCSDPTMCDAIALRMCDMGTTSSPPPATAGPGTARKAGAAAAADAAGAAAAAGADVPPAATASITSFFVIRPPVPLPEICERSS